MKIFDQRHRWGEVSWSGARYSRTCSVCGRTDTAEAFIPNAVLAAMIRQIEKPNPYRTLFARVAS